MADVLFPPSVYPQHKQGLLMSANIKYPVRGPRAHAALGYPAPFRAPLVYVPHFGDDGLDAVFRETGGDPLADEDRDKLCLVTTAPIPGVRDEVFRYGRVLRDGQCHEEALEDEASTAAFLSGAREVQRRALAVIAESTDQSFQVAGAKLNTLGNGRCNVVLFLRFPGGCPFPAQAYLRSERLRCHARIIPRPIITSFKEDQPGYKLRLHFLAVDDDLFRSAYALCQAVVAEDLGMHLRFIKADARSRCLVICAQVLAGARPVDMGALLKRIERRRNFRAAFSPYVYVRADFEEVML